MLKKLKWYMRPYYQDTSNDDILVEYLEEYKSPEKAASILWGELPAVITTGLVKSYNTGASSTVFNDPDDVLKLCKERAEYFANRARKNDTSLFVKVKKECIAGGAIE